MANGLVSFAAGFGTGLLNTMQAKKEQERREERERMEKEDRELRREQNELLLNKQRREDAQDQAVDAGLADVNAMKVGDGLRDKSGAQVPMDEEAMRKRLIDNGVAEEDAARAAPVYAQRASEKGSEQWLSNTMGDIPKVHATSKADIIRATGTALNKGNRQDRMQATQMNQKADDLDTQALQKNILEAQSMEDINKNAYDLFPDGRKLGGEVGADGKFYQWTWSQEGKPENVRAYDSFDQFKQFAASYVKDNPDEIIKAHQTLNAEQRASKKDARDDKVADLTVQQLQQKIKSGEIELASLPEETQLKLKSLKANINQSNAAAIASTEGIKIRKSEAGGDKLPNSVKEAMWYQSATPAQKEAFDKMNDKSPKVTADGVNGGFLINGKDGLMKMDADGKVSKINLDPQKTPPANRPPLSSFNK